MLFSHKISKRYILKLLSDCKYTIETKPCITSTNIVMKEKARSGENEFAVLIASRQTAGRGRMGRSFHSPAETGIYMSILLRPKENINPLLITTDAAVCCARVFENMTGESAEIKWVNDIYMRGRKVCGILTESSLGENGYAVLGIGINVLSPEYGFPEDIKDRAGAVFEHRSAHLRERVAANILQEFMKIYTSGNREELLDEYRKRSMIIGKEILVLKDDGAESATAIAIGDDYSLTIKKKNGETVSLNSGDVSIKI